MRSMAATTVAATVIEPRAGPRATAADRTSARATTVNRQGYEEVVGVSYEGSRRPYRQHHPDCQ